MKGLGGDDDLREDWMLVNSLTCQSMVLLLAPHFSGVHRLLGGTTRDVDPATRAALACALMAALNGGSARLVNALLDPTLIRPGHPSAFRDELCLELASQSLDIVRRFHPHADQPDTDFGRRAAVLAGRASAPAHCDWAAIAERTMADAFIITEAVDRPHLMRLLLAEAHTTRAHGWC